MRRSSDSLRLCPSPSLILKAISGSLSIVSYLSQLSTKVKFSCFNSKPCSLWAISNLCNFSSSSGYGIYHFGDSGYIVQSSIGSYVTTNSCMLISWSFLSMLIVISCLLFVKKEGFGCFSSISFTSHGSTWISGAFLGKNSCMLTFASYKSWSAVTTLAISPNVCTKYWLSTSWWYFCSLKSNSYLFIVINRCAVYRLYARSIFYIVCFIAFLCLAIKRFRFNRFMACFKDENNISPRKNRMWVASMPQNAYPAPACTWGSGTSWEKHMTK